jgi:hypothetical protein
MIKRSLITALVLLLAYHFIQPRLSGDYYWNPGQQRANYQRAQQYIHDSRSDLNVVVGSSMANELSQEILGPKFAKLTFPAGGSFTGLEIIRTTGKKPPVLFIESNTILRGTDEDLLKDVLSPWRRKLRDASPIFKEEGRPSQYQLGFANFWVGRICKGFSKVFHRGSPPAPAQEPPTSATMLDGVMRANREHLNRPLSEKDLTAKVSEMGELVDEFTRAGTKIVLFEMPIDSTLENLGEPAAVRNAMRARFPADRYTWLEFESNRSYQTSDGIHLVRAEADLVTRKIAEFVK